MQIAVEESARALSFIQECVKQRRILWTYYVNMRLRGRSIARGDILAAVENYEIVEAYPADKYLPSFLVRARFQSESFHILFALDREDGNVRVVTAYRPDPKQWMPDLKTRRKP